MIGLSCITPNSGKKDDGYKIASYPHKSIGIKDNK